MLRARLHTSSISNQQPFEQHPDINVVSVQPIAEILGGPSPESQTTKSTVHQSPMVTQTVVHDCLDRPRNFPTTALVPSLQTLGERAISLPSDGLRTPVGALQMNPCVMSSDEDSPLTRLSYAKRFSPDAPISPLDSRAKSMMSPRPPSMNSLRGNTGLGYAERFSPDAPMSPLDSRTKSMMSPRAPAMNSLKGNLSKRNWKKQNANDRTPMLPTAIRSQRSSPPRPTRKAVLIYLTYLNTAQVKSLSSCAKEISRLYDLLLIDLCFYKENIWVLSDEPRIVPGAVSFTATRANISNALKWLMTDICRGDQLMFYYCGQATLLRTFEREMKSSPEYCIIPADFPSASAISSPELSNTLVQGLPDGATLTALFDCRHSEKIMKMPYIHSITRRRRRKFNLEEELEIPTDQLASPRDIVLSSILRIGRFRKEADLRRKAALHRRNKAALSLFDNGTVICIAASAECEADSSLCVEAKNHGILTSSFVSYMKHASGEEEKTDYRTMLCEMASWMYSRGELRLPMLHSSHNISPNMKVTLFEK